MDSGVLFASVVFVCVPCREAQGSESLVKGCAAAQARGSSSPALCPGRLWYCCTAGAALTSAHTPTWFKANQGFCTHFTAKMTSMLPWLMHYLSRLQYCWMLLLQSLSCWPLSPPASVFSRPQTSQSRSGTRSPAGCHRPQVSGSRVHS